VPIQVSYMGTKRKIAPQVAAIIGNGPKGPLLDLFSGICAIGSEVAPSRPIWCNDIQLFASTVAAAFFTSSELPVSYDVAAEIAFEAFQENKAALERVYALQLKNERTAIASKNFHLLAALEHEIPVVSSNAKMERERIRLASAPTAAPYRLFSIIFAGGYLGLSQSIEIDSIRYAIDQLSRQKNINEEQHRWMCLALCQATSKVATTTGHFAQFMKVKTTTIPRFVAQRSRSVWHEWLRAIFKFEPLSTRSWRARNLVFREEAVSLLDQLYKKNKKPSIIYADPPYTSDHYSRYYHLYETLLKYDYPPSNGIGRYRPDRFASHFSTKSKVREAVDNLIAASAQLGSVLVLSYPGSGLLPEAEAAITSMIKRHYGNGGEIARLVHSHSSLGASKGSQNYAVNELIFIAG